MTLLPHLLNAFTKPKIDAQLAFAPFEVGVCDRKQIVQELPDAALSCLLRRRYEN
jgi:hypothetical protein